MSFATPCEMELSINVLLICSCDMHPFYFEHGSKHIMVLRTKWAASPIQELQVRQVVEKPILELCGLPACLLLHVFQHARCTPVLALECLSTSVHIPSSSIPWAMQTWAGWEECCTCREKILLVSLSCSFRILWHVAVHLSRHVYFILRHACTAQYANHKL